jgi:hypothetical protein
VRAGILEEDTEYDLVAGILKDPSISERQKQVLIDIYKSFVEAKSEKDPGSSPKRTTARKSTKLATAPRVQEERVQEESQASDVTA